MARTGGATKEEVEAVRNKYRQSGLTKQEYCKREGLTGYKLDYCLRRFYKLRDREAKASKKSQALAATSKKTEEPATTRLARVEVRPEANAAPATPASQGFVMTLSNGRRIEVYGWGFQDNDLVRLIQVAERA